VGLGAVPLAAVAPGRGRIGLGIVAGERRRLTLASPPRRLKLRAQPDVLASSRSFSARSPRRPRRPAPPAMSQADEGVVGGYGADEAAALGARSELTICVRLRVHDLLGPD